MKYLILIGICAGTMMLASCHHHRHNINITVNESGGIYRFTAYYPEEKTRKVQQLINESISPNSLFSGPGDYMDVSTTLQDKTRFAIKSSPGTLKIKLDRDENTVASYQRIKEMCEEIKNTLKQ
jgi:hypothetical protein